MYDFSRIVFLDADCLHYFSIALSPHYFAALKFIYFVLFLITFVASLLLLPYVCYVVCEQLRMRDAHFGYIHSAQAPAPCLLCTCWCMRLQIFIASKVVSVAFNLLIGFANVFSVYIRTVREHKANLSISIYTYICTYIYTLFINIYF